MTHRLYTINGIATVDILDGSLTESKRRMAKLHCVSLDDIKLIKAFSIADDIVSNRQSITNEDE